MKTNNPAAVKAATRLLVALPVVAATLVSAGGSAALTALATAFNVEPKPLSAVLRRTDAFTVAKDGTVALTAEVAADAAGQLANRGLDNVAAVEARKAKLAKNKAAKEGLAGKLLQRGVAHAKATARLAARYAKISSEPFSDAVAARIAAEAAAQNLAAATPAA